MADAPHAAETTAPDGPQDQPNRPSVGLLRLVRRCIAYGEALVGALQRRNTPTAPQDIAWRFGTISLTLVIARLTRGLRLAEALAQRLQRGAARRDAIAQGTMRPPSAPRRPPASPASPRPPRAPRPDEVAELANLPSAQEIAARVRNRPVGAVIVEICRDLGIDGEHPLWGEVLRAITLHGGNRGDLIRATLRRASEALAAGVVPVLSPAMDALFRSGPPSAWATAPP